ncbi:energy-coupling factor ABC transporter permease [Patescibacteria group bacterium]|nr:energy-coupling factor ABC transporter permease [Patescibacteria group bacterium]
MHLPDGIINNQISVGFIAVAVGFLIASFSKLRKSLTEKVVASKLALADGPAIESPVNQRSLLTKKGKERMELMAMLGALIFALQMINFPVTNGTSGHLIGGFLLAVTLGPWAGLLVISMVLAVQSLVFADGGLLALGANIFNMGVIASLGGYFLYRLLSISKLPQFVIIGFVSWLTVVSASLFCALEIGLSGTINFSAVVPAMVKIHSLIGLGEVLLTVLIIKALRLKLYEG